MRPCPAIGARRHAMFQHEIPNGRRIAVVHGQPPKCHNTFVSSDAKATASVVSDLLLPHKLQLVQRGVPIGNLIRLAREAESRNASVL